MRIASKDLAFVDRIEELLRADVPGDLRCRVTPDGVVIEADHLPAAATALAENECLLAGRNFLGQRPYRRGSAFVLQDPNPAERSHG